MAHPMDAQNALERKIQIEGNANPDHFKMPDGRTLTEVRQSNEKTRQAEYNKQTKVATELAREQSLESRNPLGELGMDKSGNILDITKQEVLSPDKPKPTTQTNTSTESSLPTNP